MSTTKRLFLYTVAIINLGILAFGGGMLLNLVFDLLFSDAELGSGFDPQRGATILNSKTTSFFVSVWEAASSVQPCSARIWDALAGSLSG